MTKILKTSYENNPILQICPECKNGIILDTYTGDTICDSCGLVISENFLDISNFEKNMFSYEEVRDKARSGFIDILFTPKSYFNTTIKKYEIKNKDLNRRAILDKYTHDSEVRNLIIAIRYLKHISSRLRFSYQVKAKAMLIYRKALKKNLIRGRSIIGVICACLYFACRNSKIPISIQEIIKESDVKENKVRKYYLFLIKDLKLKVIPLGPEAFLSKYITNLNLSFEIEKKARMLLPYLKSFSIGRDPKIISISLIYFLCKKSQIYRRQKEITAIAGITETSLRNTYKQIENYFQEKNIL